MRKNKDKLRRCPTCDQELPEEIGMRDYSTWAFGNLPGKADGTDVDRVVERKSHFLSWEFKPSKHVPTGQRIFFDALASQPNWTVYLAVDRLAHKDIVEVGRWVPGQGVTTWWTMTRAQCAELETMWYEEVEYLTSNPSAM